MKKGIVLLMTLGFIAVITALILWFLNITNERFDRVAYLNQRNQFNIIYEDFSNMVKKFDINSSDKLDILLSIDFPAMPTQKSGLGVGFSSKSLMDKLNINYILDTIAKSDNNSSKKEAAIYYLRAFEKFLSKFELSDSGLFINMMLDTIDLDDVERGSYSEIANEDFDFRQGKIYDFKTVKKIEDNYYKAIKDANIYKINKDEFEKYFYFGDIKKYGLLDCSQEGSLDTFSLILEDEMSLNEEMDLCKETNSSSMKKLKKIYNISQYSNKSKYLVRCKIDLDLQDRFLSVSFDYEVNSKRISNIDKSF